MVIFESSPWFTLGIITAGLILYLWLVSRDEEGDLQKSLTHERPEPDGSAPEERTTSQDNNQADDREDNDKIHKN